uniref:Uncharacterized protein n=1 Tax=Plantago major TaxID=29818 RepID=Q5ZF84_PLAMJ|nr:hypothetical protein [Plantago major]
MEHEVSKDMNVEVPEVISPTSSVGGLNRQGSVTKHSCLCSPTTHAGSFRCRLHRAPSFNRTKSIDSSQSKAAPSNDIPVVNAQ